MKKINETTTNQCKNEYELLTMAKNILFNLNKENISQSVKSIINIFDDTHMISFSTIISQIIYIFFEIKMNNYDEILDFIKEITLHKKIVFDIFTSYLHIKCLGQNGSCYLIENMIENNFLESKFIKNVENPYFIHYMTEEKINDMKYVRFMDEIMKNYKELSKNDWELHKKLIKEGHNPNEIAKIIRNDEIEKLQEITSQSDFNFDRRIKPSLYERRSFINRWNVTLIDYAAFFSSVKCFKYLLMNGANVINAGKYAVAGGNEEIIHLCEQNHSSFTGAYKTAIKFHRNDIFKYIYENKIEEIENLGKLGKKCILFHNYEIFSFLLKNGMKINDSIINRSAKIGNLYLMTYFLKEYQLPKDILVSASCSGNIELMKYILEHYGIDINAKDNYEYTALMVASQNGYADIVKFLIEQEGIDINAEDKYGFTPFIFASYYGQPEIVKIFIEHGGIDINAKDNHGETALICASRNGHTEIVKLLLEQEGIDINVKDDSGEIALMKASSNGHKEIIKLLMKKN